MKYHYAHFTEEETEIQGSEVTGLRSYMVRPRWALSHVAEPHRDSVYWATAAAER